MKKKKTGGRRRGSKNKMTIARESAIAASGVSPLDYMLTVMRDETADSARRDRMAQAAAPFLHAKVAAIAPEPEPAPKPLRITFKLDNPNEVERDDKALASFLQNRP